MPNKTVFTDRDRQDYAAIQQKLERLTAEKRSHAAEEAARIHAMGRCFIQVRDRGLCEIDRESDWAVWAGKRYVPGDRQARKHVTVAERLTEEEARALALGIEGLNVMALAAVELRPALAALFHVEGLGYRAVDKGRQAGEAKLAAGAPLAEACTEAERVARRAANRDENEAGPRPRSPDRSLDGDVLRLDHKIEDLLKCMDRIEKRLEAGERSPSLVMMRDKLQKNIERAQVLQHHPLVLAAEEAAEQATPELAAGCQNPAPVRQGPAEAPAQDPAAGTLAAVVAALQQAGDAQRAAGHLLLAAVLQPQDRRLGPRLDRLYKRLDLSKTLPPEAYQAWVNGLLATDPGQQGVLALELYHRAGLPGYRQALELLSRAALPGAVRERVFAALADLEPRAAPA